MTKVRTPLATAVLLGKRMLVALAAGAVAVNVFAAPASAEPTGGPGEPTCQAEIISNSAQELTGRRSVADTFFGDYPTAVHDAERAVQEFCASQ
jgi:hypothetical protein